MSFCPECGKSAAADATRCVHCGHAFPASEKKAAAARFKGTMMMAAPAIAKAGEPANANADHGQHAAHADKLALAQTAVGAAPQAALGAVARAVAQPVAAAKPNLKATMIGAGVAPAVARAAAHATAPEAHAPAIDVSNPTPLAPPAEPPPRAVGFAATQVAFSPATPPREAAAEPSPAEPSPEPARAAPARMDEARAPQPSAAAKRLPGLRLSASDETPVVPTKDRKWVYWAVCAVVVASALLLAIGLF